MAKKRSNGEGSIWIIQRNGKPYYMGSITIGIDQNGKPIRKTTGNVKKSKVVDKLNTLKYEAKNNLLSSDSEITFGNLYLKWVENYKKNEIQNNTYDGYLTCYKLRIQPYPIANIKVANITTNILQNYFNSLQESVTPNGIKKVYMKVNACLNFAEMNNIIHKNFSKGVILPKIQKKKDDDYKVFTKEEQKRICEILDLKNTIDQIIYFTFYTGLRLGEVLAVRWERIKENMYEVREQYQRDTLFLENGKKKTIYIFKDLLKTPHAERDVPLSNKILNFLNTIPKNHSLIFCDENGDPIERKKPERRIKKLCRKLEIDDNRNFKSVRHSYCTRLFEANVPIKTVQSLMGHADAETTMVVYTHVMKEKKLEVIDVLDNI